MAIACSSITSGLVGAACGSNPGGISEVYLANLSVITGVSSTGGTVSGVTGGSGAFYRYSFRPNTGNVQQETIKDLSTGAAFYRQTLVINLDKISKTNRDQLLLLDSALVVAIVKFANGQYWMFGHGLLTEGEGMYVSTNVASTGTAKTDGNGYIITMLAEEANPMNPVDPALMVVGGGGLIAA